MESPLRERRLFKAMTAGSTVEALAGVAAVVLAIVGLEGGVGAEALAGGVAIVLGILALAGVETGGLNLIALLAIGVSILLSGAALGGRSASLLVSSV